MLTVFPVGKVRPKPTKGMFFYDIKLLTDGEASVLVSVEYLSIPISPWSS